MSHLQRLSVRGVRSFDPDEAQEIIFYPLTIILGPNGAGKTTIIESLKYATTGMLPPNSNQGKTFIHDIQYANQPIVRGQVRLRFTDIENKSTTITRSIQASAKLQKGKTSVIFRQMNSVIKRDNRSIDQKCADINNELLELIGVSKAVLTNVIFCHQEETNWPLSEGKVLKEKFDDIFGSIGYVKVLEKIKKIREEEVKKLKLVEKDVNLTSYLKKEANKKRKEINEEKAKIEVEKKRNKEMEEKIKETNIKLEELIEKESCVEDLMNELSQIEGSLGEKRHLAKKIECTLSAATLAKSQSKVKHELEHFDKNSASLISSKTEIENKIKSIESKYYELNKEKQKLSINIAEIGGLENQFKKLVTQRNDLIFQLDYVPAELDQVMAKISDKLELTATDCKLVIKHLEDRVTQLEADSLAEQSTIRERQQEYEAKLDDLKHKQSNALHEKDIWWQQLSKFQQEFTQLNESMSSSQMSSANHLKMLETTIEQYRTKLDKCENVHDDQYKEKLIELEKQKKEMKDEIEQLEHQLEIANVYNDKKIKFDLLTSQQKNKLAKKEKIKMKHLNVFCEVGAEERNFYDRLSELISLRVADHEQAANELVQHEKAYSVCRSKLESQQALYSKQTKQLADCQRKFVGLCQVDEFESFRHEKEQQLQNLRTERSNLAQLAPVIDVQIEVIEKEKMCPVCENDLTNGWTSKKSATQMSDSSLIEQLKKTKHANPNELQRIDLELKQTEEVYNRLLLLTSDCELITNITTELPVIKKEIEETEKEFSDLKNTIDSDGNALQQAKNKIDNLRACLQDANDYDFCCAELQEIERELSLLDVSKWPAELDDIDELNRKLKMKQLAYKSVDKNFSDMQKNMLKAGEERLSIQNHLQVAEKNKADFEKSQHDKLNKMNKQKELKVQMEELQQKVIQLESKASAFKPEIDKLEYELTLLSDKLKQLEQDCQNNSLKYREMAREFTSFCADIDEYRDKLGQSRVNKMKQSFDQLEQDISEVENQKKTFTVQLNQLTQDIANLELQKREMLDYQRYLDLKQSIEEQEEKVREYQKKIGFTDMASIKRSRISAEKELTNLETKLRIGLERIGEFESRIESIGAELAKEEYATAHSQYRDKLLDKTLCELACDDLNKYYKALDISISSFHKCKMEEINKLLKKFWEVAYQGKDIDYIKIISDEEERSATDRRRTYNYRVVMVRGNKEMDMKGRCSAGQKVLASLIIRLALAVIFCRNFAVLTLDEPTTNLDKANIRSFAKAVINLVKSNRNFQIIIITHDEEFLDCLDADTGQHYYQVSKFDAGYSCIECKTVNENVSNTQATTTESTISNSVSKKVEESNITLQFAPKRTKHLANDDNAM